MVREPGGRTSRLPRMLTPALVCPELIGRRGELDALAEHRRAAAAGRGALVLISGDAGIGKTRLLRAFRESLTGGRATVAAGGYDEFANEPYGAIVEALRSAGSHEPLASERTRAEQLAALVDRLAATCARRNVVLLLEDVHWADEASFAFLLHLMRSLATLRLLVVATYRSDEIHRGHVATPYIARLARDPLTQRIALEPFRAPDMQRFIRATLDGRARLARRTIDDIVERSDGNPFFAEELLKNALEHVDAPSASGVLPLTIRAAVAERLKLLDARALSVISLAAVVGRRFDARFLATIAGLPVAAVFEVLRGARDLQLIDELPTHPVSYAFRHALTRDAIYGDMLLGEVQPLHLRIVAALEQEGAERHVADLGYHAWAGRDATKSVSYNERAGDDAEAVHAYHDAVRSYERALEFEPDGAVRGRLLEKLARSTAHDGNAARAARLAQGAIEAYRRSGDDRRVADLYYFVAAELHSAGESDRAMEFLREGHRAQPPDVSPADRARLALPLAYMLLDRGALSEAQGLIDESSAAADDVEFGPMYWNTRTYVAGLRADLSALHEAGERSLKAAEHASPERRLRAHMNFGIALSELGEDRLAAAQFGVIAQQLRERRLSALEVLVGGYDAVHHARGGRLAEGRAIVERLLRVAEPWMIARAALAVASLMVGRVLCDEDLMARASGPDLLEAAFRSQIGATIGAMAGPYARRLHDRGEHADALAILRRALDVLVTPYGATETLIAAIELGDAKMRRDAIALIETIEGTIPLYAATVARMRAVAARREGDARSAHDFALTARERYTVLGWDYHVAVCTELTGDTESAAHAFRSMGALFDARRLELGAVAHSAHRDASGGLSRREWEIAELIAGGTPNRRVAERLSLSEKTVEKHLTAIYGKLGFRNRSQLAAFVIRKES